MKDWCEKCTENTYCKQCGDQLDYAMKLLNMSLCKMYELGYEVPKKMHFEKRKKDEFIS